MHNTAKDGHMNVRGHTYKHAMGHGERQAEQQDIHAAAV
jgi:hypothetical protein